MDEELDQQQQETTQQPSNEFDSLTKDLTALSTPIETKSLEMLKTALGEQIKNPNIGSVIGSNLAALSNYFTTGQVNPQLLQQANQESDKLMGSFQKLAALDSRLAALKLKSGGANAKAEDEAKKSWNSNDTTKLTREMYQTYTRLEGLRTEKAEISDVPFTFNFLRLTDPNFRNIASLDEAQEKAKSMGTQGSVWVQRLAKGGTLKPTEKEEMFHIAGKTLSGQLATQDLIDTGAKNLAKERGYKPENVIEPFIPDQKRKEIKINSMNKAELAKFIQEEEAKRAGSQ